MSEAKKYPFLNLIDATAPQRDEIVAAVTRVIDSGRYIGGDECRLFEEELTKLCDVPYCIGVSNGLDALRLIFRSYVEMGVMQPGDEVLIPANTYIASVLAVTEMGLKPVFVDVDASTMNIDWKLVPGAVSERTKALLTVHLYGRVAWNENVIRELRNSGVVVVEDNAQAIGAMTPEGLMTGSLGDAAAFSFYPTKNIGALGDAGAVTTRDKRIADMVRALANYGSDKRYHNIYEGYNCRLDPIQAAVLRVKLRSLEAENRRRSAIADIYGSQINNPEIKLPAPGKKDAVWHQYVIQVTDRPDFLNFLDKNGIGWDIHYPVPPHRQPCYSEYAATHLPVTEDLAEKIVSLPISATTSERDAREIAAILNGYKKNGCQ